MSLFMRRCAVRVAVVSAFMIGGGATARPHVRRAAEGAAPRRDPMTLIDTGPYGAVTGAPTPTPDDAVPEGIDSETFKQRKSMLDRLVKRLTALPCNAIMKTRPHLAQEKTADGKSACPETRVFDEPSFDPTSPSYVSQYAELALSWQRHPDRVSFAQICLLDAATTVETAQMPKDQRVRMHYFSGQTAVNIPKTGATVLDASDEVVVDPRTQAVIETALPECVPPTPEKNGLVYRQETTFNDDSLRSSLQRRATDLWSETALFDWLFDHKVEQLEENGVPIEHYKDSGQISRDSRSTDFSPQLSLGKLLRFFVAHPGTPDTLNPEEICTAEIARLDALNSTNPGNVFSDSPWLSGFLGTTMDECNPERHKLSHDGFAERGPLHDFYATHAGKQLPGTSQPYDGGPEDFDPENDRIPRWERGMKKLINEPWNWKQTMWWVGGIALLAGLGRALRPKRRSR